MAFGTALPMPLIALLIALPLVTAPQLANVHVQPGGDVRIVAGASLNIGEDGTLNNGGPAVDAPHTKLRQHVLWRCLMQDGTGVGVRRRDITAVTIAATAIAA